MNNNTDADVALLACGGTIDKIYFDALSEYSIGESAATDIFRRARTPLPPLHSVIKKDSLDMTDDDRTALLAAVLDCPQKRIVVTHGTDTLAQSAQFVAAKVQDKTVVFVGAFSPAVFRSTDADFNIGFALAAAQTLPPGVYVAMNGKIFLADKVTKNRKAAQFQSTE